MEFILMNKNKEILSFFSEVNEFGEVLFEQTDQATGLLPVGFTEIQSYLEQRRAPKSRKHIRELLLRTGTDNLEQYLLITRALGLNDTFWVKRGGEDISWEEVSLYRNDFNETIARLAFDGEGVIQSSSSPEFQTDGTYAKCWKRTKNEIVLLKAGSDQLWECISEYLASQLCNALGLKHVPYELVWHHGKIVTSCPLFTDEEVGFGKAAYYLDESKCQRISYLLDFFREKGFEEEFRWMVVLDALLLNVDRHTGNYGFMVKNNTLEIVDMAPLFDHNRSLLFDSELPLTKEKLRNLVPRIGADFNQTAHMLLTDSIKRRLRNLTGFEFSENEMMTEQQRTRTSVLSRLVNHQIENVLNGQSLYHCNELLKL